MDDFLGEIFRVLMQAGGGSDLLPLAVFSVALVLVGLGLGLGIMRLFGRLRGSRDDDPVRAGD